MPTKGLSILFFQHIPGAGRRTEDCRVCGTSMTMTVEKCASSWAQAMAKSTSTYDVYKCPMVENDWHKQAEEIKSESERTRSPALKRLFDGDVKQICMDGLKSGARTRRKSNA